jgi:hypothetical protein
MKLRSVGISIGILLALAVACSGAAEGTPDAPLAAAPEPIFTFEPVLEGEEVVHDFVVENRGTAELQIHRVENG